MKKVKDLVAQMIALSNLSNDPYHKGVANGAQAAINLFLNKPNDPVPFDPAEGIHLFPMRVKAMNRKYELPVHSKPTLPKNALERLQDFKVIMLKEVAEIDAIADDGNMLADIADLLADITVYCRSEAARFGIPLEEVLQIVMDSNDSKLGADGKPIKDENDKFLKGPNFVPPEPAIRELLLGMMKDDTSHT